MSISTCRFHRRHPFLFSCFHDYQEDYATTQFMMKAMKKNTLTTEADDAITFVSFYDLAVLRDGSILLPDGRTANAIYRLHPLEILIEEKTPEGETLGKDFMDGYLQDMFMMFNPPEAIIMQSKAFQALVWALTISRQEQYQYLRQRSRRLLPVICCHRTLPGILCRKRLRLVPVFCGTAAL